LKGLLFAAAALALAAPVLAAPPQVRGRAYLVENGTSGEVLAARDAHARVPIASITKLMTVLLTVERTRPSDVVTVSARAAAVGESSANLRAGERLTVRELLEAAFADYVGRGDEGRFVALMNQRARQLGLRDTHYVRPDGLDAVGHVSSAHDVTLLARILMHRPLVRQIVRQRSATIAGGEVLHTWNDLLSSFPGVFGVKTGHTANAGWNEVAAARRGGLTVYATLLGSPDRYKRNADLTKLLDWGFSRYRPATVVTRGQAYARTAVGYGRKPVELVAAASLTPALRVGFPVVRQVVAMNAARLPVARGQSLGLVRVYQRGKLVGAVPLVASRAVAKPGLGGRVGWYATRTLHHMAGWFS
jgi:D-alanyl-D-alanine carboxypeptidase (penicillin-binding protein 5/6)